MLLTTCPECSAQFKVQTEQLNVRQGRVMCGRCRHVFNAFETLMRQDDFSPDTSLGSGPQESKTASSADRLMVPPATSADSPALLKTTASPAVGTLAAFRAAGRPGKRNEAQNSLPSSLLKSGKQGDNSLDGQQNYRLWGLAASVLALIFIAQLLYFFRGNLVQAYPQFRPRLAAACNTLGCTISWGRDKDAVVIESSDLVEPPGRPGEYMLSTVIANRSNTMQDLPVLDMRLTDSNNQALLRRVFQPAEYLGRALNADEGIAPGAGVLVNLSVAVDRKIVASGYIFDVFYP